MESETIFLLFLLDWHLNDVTLKSIWRHSCIDIGACQTVYAMLLEFSDSLQTEILSTETSDFLKQIIFLNSFESVFKAGPKCCVATKKP